MREIFRFLDITQFFAIVAIWLDRFQRKAKRNFVKVLLKLTVYQSLKRPEKISALKRFLAKQICKWATSGDKCSVASSLKLFIMLSRVATKPIASTIKQAIAHHFGQLSFRLVVNQSRPFEQIIYTTHASHTERFGWLVHSIYTPIEGDTSFELSFLDVEAHIREAESTL